MNVIVVDSRAALLYLTNIYANKGGDDAHRSGEPGLNLAPS